MSSQSTLSLLSSIDGDCDDLASGDLGLGMGLKPGALPIAILDLDQDDDITDRLIAQVTSPTAIVEQRYDNYNMVNHVNYDIQNRNKFPAEAASPHDYVLISNPVSVPANLQEYAQNDSKLIEKLSISKRLSANFLENSNWKERKRFLSRSRLTSDGNKAPKTVRVKKVDDLIAKLAAANEEVDYLRSELNAYRKQIVSKDGAVKILQNQAFLAEARQQHINAIEEETNKKLKEEVNALRWELEIKEKQILNSEEAWSDRYNRVATENKALLATLEARSTELKRLYSEKMAITREKDLLASAVKIQSKISEDNSEIELIDIPEGLNKDTMADELAILGACHCMDGNETCICAKAAAITKRENIKLRNRMKKIATSNEEILHTADNYRKAFEEQLNQNTTLMLSIEMMRKDSSFNSSKVKLSYKNKNEGRRSSVTDDTTNSKLIKGAEKKKTLEEANATITMLQEMLNDREEALAHQKIAARILAKKTKELEGKIDRLQVDPHECQAEHLSK